MNVLQIITKGEAGGAQSHVLTLCRTLQGQIEQSVVIGGSDPASPLETKLQALGIPVQRVPLMANTLSPWRVLRATYALTRILRQQRPDVIHAHSAIASVVARLAGMLTRTPVVYTVHGFGFKPRAPLFQSLAALTVEWLLAPLTTRMICVSEHERELARRLPLAAQHICVIHNGIEDHPLRADPSAEPLQLIMVARCAPPKRQDLLLQALALASTRLGHEIPATFVGDGPQRPALLQQTQALGLHRVRFTGDTDQVPELLARHGLFVLVSDHEGLPISVIEALRCGLPILSNDLPGMHELVEHNQQGLLVAQHAGMLADALVTLAKQPALRSHMGHAARRRYEQHHQANEMTRAVYSVYDQIQDHDTRPPH